jgi:MoaA/NifB/PqqE/SkfB family radical SAM enzyme
MLKLESGRDGRTPRFRLLNIMLYPLTKSVVYNVARKTGRLRPRPLNLTFSVTYRCNAKCQTCNVWKKRVDDFTLDEYRKLFKNLGTSLYWATFSGGEPFIRPDLIDIVCACYDRCRPGIITIPTNGLLQKRILDGVARLSRHARNTKIIINFSLDGIGERHDELRGVPGNYEKVRDTYRKLKAAGHPNVTVGIHTVVSQLNVREVPALRDHVRKEFGPDSFITEVAEERLELDTIGMDITPSADAYGAVVEDLLDDMDTTTGTGMSSVVQAFRRQYYQIAHRTLKEQRQVLPCYAGLASAQIAPNGDVWTCCTRAESMGNLREANFDFDKVWTSNRADELRGSIRRGECHCPLANAAYSSMLCDPPSLMRVGLGWLKSQLRPSAKPVTQPVSEAAR